MAKPKRTAKQIAATKKLVKMNKAKARAAKAGAKEGKSTKSRKANRAAGHAAAKAKAKRGTGKGKAARKASTAAHKGKGKSSARRSGGKHPMALARARHGGGASQHTTVIVPQSRATTSAAKTGKGRRRTKNIRTRGLHRAGHISTTIWQDAKGRVVRETRKTGSAKRKNPTFSVGEMAVMGVVTGTTFLLANFVDRIAATMKPKDGKYAWTNGDAYARILAKPTGYRYGVQLGLAGVSGLGAYLTRKKKYAPGIFLGLATGFFGYAVYMLGTYEIMPRIFKAKGDEHNIGNRAYPEVQEATQKLLAERIKEQDAKPMDYPGQDEKLPASWAGSIFEFAPEKKGAPAPGQAGVQREQAQPGVGWPSGSPTVHKPLPAPQKQPGVGCPGGCTGASVSGNPMGATPCGPCAAKAAALKEAAEAERLAKAAAAAGAGAPQSTPRVAGVASPRQLPAKQPAFRGLGGIEQSRYDVRVSN